MCFKKDRSFVIAANPKPRIITNRLSDNYPVDYSKSQTHINEPWVVKTILLCITSFTWFCETERSERQSAGRDKRMHPAFLIYNLLIVFESDSVQHVLQSKTKDLKPNSQILPLYFFHRKMLHGWKILGSFEIHRSRHLDFHATLGPIIWQKSLAPERMAGHLCLANKNQHILTS